MLQNLMPSPGSSYAGYSQLQHAASNCSSSSLYSLSPGDAQHLLTSGLSHQQPQPQQLPQQLPHPQSQLQACQEMHQAMRMLSLGSSQGYEVDSA